MTYRKGDREPPKPTADDTAFIASVQAWAESGPPSFREQHLPEYRVRLLDVYAACAGWPHAAITPLWPLVTLASEAFEHENLEAWRGTLTELETRVAAVPANPASNPPGGAEMAAQAQGGASVGAQHE